MRNKFFKNNYKEQINLQNNSIFVIDTSDKGNETITDIKKQYIGNVLEIDILDYNISLDWNELVDSTTPKVFKSLLKGYIASAFEFLLVSTGNYNIDETEDIAPLKLLLNDITSHAYESEGSTVKNILTSITRGRNNREHTKKVEGSLLKKLVDSSDIVRNDIIINKLLYNENKTIDFNQLLKDQYCIILKINEKRVSEQTLNILLDLIYTKIWSTILINSMTSAKRKPVYLMTTNLEKYKYLTRRIEIDNVIAKKIKFNYILEKEGKLYLKPPSDIDLDDIIVWG